MFIVIEGIDGAGTTTQTELLANALGCLPGLDAESTREPTDSAIGKMIREIIKSDSGMEKYNTPEILANLFAADRLFHGQHLQDFVGSNDKWIVSDRYDLSSIAYQSISHETMEVDSTLHKFVKDCNQLAVKPDLVIFIDTQVDECLSRIHKRSGELDSFENEWFLTKCRQAYIDTVMARYLDNYFDTIFEYRKIVPGEYPGCGYDVVRIDGDQSVEDVEGDIWKVVRDRFNLPI